MRVQNFAEHFLLGFFLGFAGYFYGSLGAVLVELAQAEAFSKGTLWQRFKFILSWFGKADTWLDLLAGFLGILTNRFIL